MALYILEEKFHRSDPLWKKWEQYGHAHLTSPREVDGKLGFKYK